VRPRLMAAIRKVAAARFADGWVCELKSRPPETLFLCASVNHNAKSLRDGHRRMSVPLSDTYLSAVHGAMP
jgi:hypothetical protein